MLNWLFGDKTEREAKQLNRDAPLIIEQAKEMFGPPSMIEVAKLAGQHIERAHKIYGTETIDLKRALDDYRKLHKDARRNTDQRGLSAMTLVIIYLRSELAGSAAAPARDVINTFVTDFKEGAQLDNS
jgi:hypothetical protein